MLVFSENCLYLWKNRLDPPTKLGGRMAGKNTRYNISPEEFVRAYETSESYEEVQEKTGMPYEVIVTRAHEYRKKGAKLKKLGRRGRKGLDVEALNQLIEEIAREKEKKTSEGRKKPGK